MEIYSSRILYGGRMELPLSGGRMGGTGVLPGPPLLPSSQPPLADSPWSLLNSPLSFRQSLLSFWMLKMPNTCLPVLCIMGMGLWPILGQKDVKKQSFLGGQGRLQRTDFPPIKKRERQARGKSLHSSTLFLHMVAWGSTIWRDRCETLKGDTTHRLRRADGKAPASWWTLVQYSKNLAVGQALSMCWSGQSHGFGEGCFVAAILAFYYTLRFLHIPYYQLNLLWVVYIMLPCVVIVLCIDKNSSLRID